LHGCSIKNNVFLLGNISDAEFKYLLNETELFVYIPLYEGFGLPVLEAMAAGAEILTSSTTSLPEVIGNTGHTVNPESQDKVVQKIKEILKEKRLDGIKRIDVISRARAFSWGKSAQQHMNIFKRIL